MKRLYKFFFLLFLVFLVLSFIYGTLVSWITYKMIQSSLLKTMTIGPVSFADFLVLGIVQALVYSLVLLLFIIFLLKRSVDNGQKFTIRNIVTVTGWFFLVTSIVYIIHYISFPRSLNLSNVLLLAGPQLFQPSYLWFPFPLAWLSLFIILYARIKKAD